MAENAIATAMMYATTSPARFTIYPFAFQRPRRCLIV
jgi:hypothetical protein